MEIHYDSTDRCILYIIKKDVRNNKTNYEVNRIFLTNEENIIFKELYNNDVIKNEQFANLMEQRALATAICRLRKKIKKIYKIKNIRKLGYELIKKEE